MRKVCHPPQERISHDRYHHARRRARRAARTPAPASLVDKIELTLAADTSAAKAEVEKLRADANKLIVSAALAIHAHLIAAGAVLFVAGGVFAKLVL